MKWNRFYKTFLGKHQNFSSKWRLSLCVLKSYETIFGINRNLEEGDFYRFCLKTLSF
jgi:hypothetical protein